MALTSRKRARQEAGEPPEQEGNTESQVEVIMAGPEAERLRGLVDMTEIAAVLAKKSRAKPAD